MLNPLTYGSILSCLGCGSAASERQAYPPESSGEPRAAGSTEDDGHYRLFAAAARHIPVPLAQPQESIAGAKLHCAGAMAGQYGLGPRSRHYPQPRW